MFVILKEIYIKKILKIILKSTSFPRNGIKEFDGMRGVYQRHLPALHLYPLPSLLISIGLTPDFLVEDLIGVTRSVSLSFSLSFSVLTLSSTVSFLSGISSIFSTIVSDISSV